MCIRGSEKCLKVCRCVRNERAFMSLMFSAPRMMGFRKLRREKRIRHDGGRAEGQVELWPHF